MPNIFVSYRSLDSAKVDALVARLRTLKNNDGTPRFNIWQDKHNIPDGHDWWESIVDGIINSSVIIFMLSRESAQNINCRAELTYARKRNRPVIPLVLEGEFFYNPVTGRNDIDYWEHVPQELKDLRSQFLFYEGTSFVPRIENAIAGFEREPQRWRDIVAEKPSDPRDANDLDNNSATLYDQACDFALRLEIATAERLFLRLFSAADPIFGEDSHQWILLLRTYQTLLNLDARSNTRYKIPPLWEKYRSQFPMPFIEIFDPKDFAARFNGVPVVGISTSRFVLTEPAAGTRMTDDKGVEMVYVPPGKYLMGSTPQQVDEAFAEAQKAYAEAKRAWFEDQLPQHEVQIANPFWLDLTPVTNEAFAHFVTDGGYTTPNWWTKEGWDWLKSENINQPDDYDNFTYSLQPRVGVSWYEAFAYARWRGGRLPTEAEWEWAARGSESRIYPWGNTFDPNRLVYAENSNKLTSVVGSGIRTSGVSWVGALDMSGNVWEWCDSCYQPYSYRAEDGREKSDNGMDVRRVLRGGSWYFYRDYARSASRRSGDPVVRNYYIGFRVVRPPS